MSNQRLLHFFDTASYAMFLLMALVIPFVCDGRLANFFVLPKQFTIFGFTLAALLLFVIKVVISKTVSYRRSVIDMPLGIFIASLLFSAVFSANRYTSFYGRNEFFVLNFLFLFFLVIFYFLCINQIRTETRWRIAADVLLLTGGITGVLFLTKSIFGLDIIAPIIGRSVWNTVDAANSPFGLWTIAVGMWAIGSVIKKNISSVRLVLYSLVSLVSLVVLLRLSFASLWWILLAALVLLLVLGVNFVKEVRAGWLSALCVLTVLCVMCIVFGTPNIVQTRVPLEVALGYKPSWHITTQVLLSGTKQFMLGSGLGTFGIDFSKFRPAEFNYDQTAWSLRFNQPHNTISALVSEGGVITALLFAFIFLLTLGYILQAWLHRKNNNLLRVGDSESMLSSVQFDLFLIAAVWVLVTGSMLTMSFGPFLWWLWWYLLGLTVVGLSFCMPNILREHTWAIDDTPQYNLSFSFVLIVIMAAVVMAGMRGTQMYFAEVTYADALHSPDIASAKDKLEIVKAERGDYDLYHAALAQVYLLQAGKQAREAKPDVQAVGDSVTRAVNEARTAVDLSPRSVALLENLATMYENAAVLVPDARDWAIKTWEQAKELEPTNPVIRWRLGENLSLKSDWVNAIKRYQEALQLKRDYAAAAMGLARAYEQSQQLTQAIEVYRNILPNALTNTEVIFNFGRLLFARNAGDDRANAEKLWLEAVRLQPNYTNALYSLGFLYDLQGKKSKALEYYNKVKELEPNSKDVADKINLLNTVATPEPTLAVPAKKR